MVYADKWKVRAHRGEWVRGQWVRGVRDEYFLVVDWSWVSWDFRKIVNDCLYLILSLSSYICETLVGLSCDITWRARLAYPSPPISPQKIDRRPATTKSLADPRRCSQIPAQLGGIFIEVFPILVADLRASAAPCVWPSASDLVVAVRLGLNPGGVVAYVVASIVICR